MSDNFLRAMSVIAGVTVVTFVLVQTLIIAKYELPPHGSPPGSLHRVANVPAFQLFPPNAVISLTEDNNTFFPARPAAFGAELADGGLSAALWIGAGFGEDGVEPQGELGCSDVPGWDGKLAADGAPVLPIEGFVDDGTDNYLEEYFLGKSSLIAHKAVHAPATAVATDRDGDGKLTKIATAADAAPVIPAPVIPAAADPASNVLDSPDASHKDVSRAETGHSVPHHSDIESLQEGAEIAGKIVLLRRGGCGFLAKVMWAQRRGAVAVIVGDDRKGGPLIQMYAAGDTSFVTIPSVFTAHTTAHLLTALVAASVEVEAAALKKAAVKQANTKTAAPVPQNTEPSGEWWKTQPREWVLDEYVPTKTAAGAHPMSTAVRAAGGNHVLYVTISPTRATLPFIDMLLVVIASPVLAVVVITGVLLFIRTQYRYRAWRAPKAVVEQLPIHIYAAPGAPTTETITVNIGSAVASPIPSPPRSPSPPSLEPTLTTPLLQRPRSRTTTGVPGDERRATITVPSTVPPHRPRYFQTECVVCLEDYVAGDRVMSLPCGHEFHASCITPWLTTRRRTCPICKSDVVKAAAAGEAA